VGGWTVYDTCTMYERTIHSFGKCCACAAHLARTFFCGILLFLIIVVLKTIIIYYCIIQSMSSLVNKNKAIDRATIIHSRAIYKDND
jgi:hypothetical protein